MNSNENNSIDLLLKWLHSNTLSNQNVGQNACVTTTFVLSGCNRIIFKQTNEFVLFVNDYIKLWNFYAFTKPTSKRGHSFGSLSLLFESAILFVYEKRTVKILKFCCLWNIFIMLLVCFSQPSQILSMLGNGFVQLVLFYVYLNCAKVYKASLDENLMKSFTVVNEETKQNMSYTDIAIQSSVNICTNIDDYTFFDMLFHLGGTIKREIYGMLGYSNKYMEMIYSEENVEMRPVVTMKPTEPENDMYSNNNNMNDNKVTPMNSTTIPDSNTTTNTTNSNAKSNSKTNMSSRIEKKVFHEQLKLHSGITCQCAYYLLLNIGSRFVSSHTNAIVEVPTSGRITILTTCIIVPFMFIWNFGSTLFGYTCAIPNDFGVAPWFIGLNCTSQFIFIYGTFFTFTMFLSWTIIIIAIMSSILGMFYGSVIMHAMATSYVSRYACLRQCKKSDTATELPRKPIPFRKKNDKKNKSKKSNLKNRFDDKLAAIYEYENKNKKSLKNIEEDMDENIQIDEDTSTSKLQLIRDIEKDAYEHYLFIQVCVLY